VTVRERGGATSPGSVNVGVARNVVPDRLEDALLAEELHALSTDIAPAAVIRSAQPRISIPAIA
jgi:hypothetical protein